MEKHPVVLIQHDAFEALGIADTVAKKRAQGCPEQEEDDEDEDEDDEGRGEIAGGGRRSEGERVWKLWNLGFCR